MSHAGDDLDVTIVADTVDQFVLVIYSPAPPAAPVPFKLLWLAYPPMAVASDVCKKRVDSSSGFAIQILPLHVFVPGVVKEEVAHVMPL
jgi:hypothetical protein